MTIKRERRRPLGPAQSSWPTRRGSAVGGAQRLEGGGNDLPEVWTGGNRSLNRSPRDVRRCGGHTHVACDVWPVSSGRLLPGLRRVFEGARPGYDQDGMGRQAVQGSPRHQGGPRKRPERGGGGGPPHLGPAPPPNCHPRTLRARSPPPAL